MAEFIAITTQEEFDEKFNKRFGREKAKFDEAIEKLNEENKALKASIEAKDTELNTHMQKLQGHDEMVAKLNTELTSYKMQNLRHKIAHESGLPYDLADRLSGDDEEALKADAEILKKYVQKPQAISLATSEVEPGDDNKSSYEKALQKFAKEIKKE